MSEEMIRLSKFNINFEGIKGFISGLENHLVNWTD